VTERETEHGHVCAIDRIRRLRNSPDERVNGAVLLASQGHFPLNRPFVRVELRGDFIRGSEDRSVDGNHLAPWLPDRPSGDGTPGGLFESYFTSPALNPNNASAEDLAALDGVSRTVAENIVAHREAHGPFDSLEALAAVSGVGDATLRRIRTVLTAGDQDPITRFPIPQGGPR
jgi:competence ComEA-like helix-hairpin-helix protein